jgi:sugar O-acyltransferase (sialic acid O-acetyltransferase NeuD family)
MMKHLLLIGTGGHYKVIRSILDESLYDKVSNKQFSLPINKENINKNKKFLNSFFTKNKKEKKYIFISIGSNYTRFCIHNYLKKIVKYDYTYPNIISKFSYVSENSSIGRGNVVMPGVVINANTKIGSQCIFNTSCSIDHDNQIKNFSSVAPGVNIGGNVKIDSLTHVGIGSSINHNISIGKNVVIGGGSFINKNCKSNSIYFGVPGKFISKRKIEESYL